MFRFVRYVVKSDAYIARVDHNCFSTILLPRRRLKAKKFMDDCIADCPSERILNRRKLTPEEWRQSKVAAIEVTAVVVLYCKTSNRAWVYQGCRSRLFCYYAVYLSVSRHFLDICLSSLVSKVIPAVCRYVFINIYYILF